MKRMPHLDEKFKEFAKLDLAVDNKAFYFLIFVSEHEWKKDFKLITPHGALSFYLISRNVLCDW